MLRLSVPDRMTPPTSSDRRSSSASGGDQTGVDANLIDRLRPGVAWLPTGHTRVSVSVICLLIARQRFPGIKTPEHVSLRHDSPAAIWTRKQVVWRNARRGKHNATVAVCVAPLNAAGLVQTFAELARRRMAAPGPQLCRVMRNSTSHRTVGSSLLA